MASHQIQSTASRIHGRGRDGWLTNTASERRSGRDWLELFASAARLQDRLELLSEFGLTDKDIAKATGIAARSARRWRTEGPPATKAAERWEPIDDLLTVINYFLGDGSYDNESIVAWLRSRNPALRGRRPIEVLGEGDFSAVLTAADRTLQPQGIADEYSFFSHHPGREPSADEVRQRRRNNRRPHDRSPAGKR